MDLEKYNRTLNLLCPTCGSSRFSQANENALETELVTCASCGREIRKAELIRENSENVSEHIKEMGNEAVKDLQRQLRKSLTNAFKGNQFIKYK